MNNVITITIFVFVSVFSVAPSFAQSAKLTVRDSLIAKRTLYLNPRQEPPTTAQEGQLYYNTDGKVYFYNGTWKEIQSGKKRAVGSVIVAAYNSLCSTESDGSTCEVGDTTCNNPKADYTCTGLNDDAMIETALDALGSTGTGGKTGGAVYLLEGTYNIANPIDMSSIGVNDSGKAIIGTGKATVLQAKTAIYGIILASGVNEIRIAQLMIEGGTAQNGIVFNTVNNSRIDKVWVENFASSGVGISIAASDKNSILNNYVLSKGIGLKDSESNILSGNITCGISLGLSSIKNTISNNQIVAVSTQVMDRGIAIWGSSSNNIISSNNIQGYTVDGIMINSSLYNIVSSNNITPNYSSSNTIGINISSASNFNTISTNVIRDNYKGHILMDSSSNNSFLGNLLYEVTGATNSGIQVTAATVNSDNNLFSSNRIYDSSASSPAAGIFLEDSDPTVAPNLDKNFFTANLIDGAGYYVEYYRNARIIDNGLNSRYLQKEKINLEFKLFTVTANGGRIFFSQNPISVIGVVPSGNYTLDSSQAIEDGKAVGDILILIGYSATNKITIPNNANTRLGDPRTLGQYDVLKLIWDGDDWVEISFVDNYVQTW